MLDRGCSEPSSVGRPSLVPSAEPDLRGVCGWLVVWSMLRRHEH
jgi:hypothetical protein